MTRTWIYRGEGRVEVVDQQATTPGPDEVVVAVEGAALAAHPPAVDAVLGVSAVGSVTIAGERAVNLLGQRVVFGSCIPCGECEVCRRGGMPVCPHGAQRGVNGPGTLAEHVVVPARWITALSGPLDIPGPAAAALAGDVADAYALYARSGIGPREPVVVIGDRSIARFVIEILIAKGAPPMVITGGASRLDGDKGGGDVAIAELCRRLELPVIDPAASSIELELERLRAERGHSSRPMRIIETTARAECRALALSLAGPRSTIVLRAERSAATGDRNPDITVPAHVLRNEASLHSVVGAHPDLLVEIAALVIQGEISLDAGTEIINPNSLAGLIEPQSGARSRVVAL